MSEFVLILLIHLSFLILLAISFNITTGYLGYINMATAAICGAGANITAILTANLGWNFFPTLLLSALAGVCLGAIVGLPSVRVRGIYYLIVSIGFQLLIHDILKNSSLTGDKEGIRDIPFPALFGFSFSSSLRFLFLSLTILATVIILTLRIIESPVGRLMRSVRENELLVWTLGKNVNQIKLQSFAYSGAIAALAGSLYAAHMRFVSYESFGLDLSITLLLVVTIGGPGRFFGPVLGSVVVISIPELLHYLPLNTVQFPIFERIIYALVLLLLLRFRSSGLRDTYRELRSAIQGVRIPAVHRANL
jgi:branched-chain amino acid transport system permease protein